MGSSQLFRLFVGCFVLFGGFLFSWERVDGFLQRKCVTVVTHHCAPASFLFFIFGWWACDCVAHFKHPPHFFFICLPVTTNQPPEGFCVLSKTVEFGENDWRLSLFFFVFLKVELHIFFLFFCSNNVEGRGRKTNSWWMFVTVLNGVQRVSCQEISENMLEKCP